jgi:prepilin-type N-terminal cleavage/methylation domain-containing protein
MCKGSARRVQGSDRRYAGSFRRALPRLQDLVSVACRSICKGTTMKDRLRATVSAARTVHHASNQQPTRRVHRRAQSTQRKKNESGFTLIELLIVIVILGVLSGIVVFAVSGIQDRGNAAACKTDKKTTLVAVEAYYAKNGAYPPAGEAGWLELTVGVNQLLRERPAGNGYSITLGVGGLVTATGACT